MLIKKKIDLKSNLVRIIIYNITMATHNTKLKIQKPFLKWVGGKTQIIDTIISKIPDVMENYHEPFVGGGSVLFAVLSLQRQNKIQINGKLFVSDVNRALINVYKHIQTNYVELHDCIQNYMNVYDSLKGNEINRKPRDIDEATTSKESYYYWMRDKYNQTEDDTIDKAALFMILNKTCFRGMYREGPNGFNVPYGHYKKTPHIVNLSELKMLSELTQDVVFMCNDFAASLEMVKSGDFVYLDPPYAPETDKSFVGYVADGFNLDMHLKLFDMVKNIPDIHFAMSNSNVDLVRDTFEGYSIDEITARRAINSKNPGSKTKEVLIYNKK